VSYAAAGGGVGPHFDSYDVFLLQGPGRRRWSIGRQREPELDPKAPLRVLRNFRAEKEWLLERETCSTCLRVGRHDGVALEPCFTYSIGSGRRPIRKSPGNFSLFLQDRVRVRRYLR